MNKFIYNQFMEYVKHLKNGETTYDPITSLLMARLSGLVYNDSEPARLATLGLYGLGHAVVHYWENDSTEALGVFLPEVRIVVFRGTQVTENLSLSDIQSNLETRLEPWDFQQSPVLTHKGYTESVNDLSKKISDLLWDSTVPIIYTGHSMGAAIATLMALQSPMPVCVYSFGSPMVGNNSFWTVLNKHMGVQVYRVIYGNDLARFWPFPPFVNLWHYAKYTQGPKPIRIAKQGGILPNMSDHNIMNYIKELRWKALNE